MKKLLKKITAVIMTATIAISSMIVTTTASAAGVFDGAKKMEELEYYSRYYNQEESSTYYKITVPRSGKITFKWDSSDAGFASRTMSMVLLDSKANTVAEYGDALYWGSTEGTADLEKGGTYYLHIKQTRDDAFIKDLYYTFTPDLKPTISLKLTMKKGTSIQLGSIVENYDGKVTWTSTKKSVATVSSTGKVTAKKKGTTTIRAQLDDGTYVQIKIVVKK